MKPCWQILVAAIVFTAGAFANSSSPTCAETLVDDPSWATFGFRWRAEVAFSLRYHHRHPRIVMATEVAQAVHRQDRRLSILRYLGFQLNRSGAITVPPWDTWALAYEMRLQEHLASGRLRPEDVLRPGRLFQDSLGGMHFCDYRFDPDPSWVEIDVSAHPPLFFQMIRAGVFPVTANHRALHDLSHAAGLLDSPEYMAGIRQMATKASEENGRARGRDRHIRFFFLYEGLALVPAEKREELRHYLAEPFWKRERRERWWRPGVLRDDDRLVTVDEVRLALQQLSPSAVEKHGRRLLAAVPSLLEHYGGASRELGSTYRNRELLEAMDLLCFSAQVGIDHATGSALVTALARLEVALWESTRVTVTEIFQALGQAKVPEASPVYRMFVHSGLTDSKNRRSVLGATLRGEADSLPAEDFTFAH